MSERMTKMTFDDITGDGRLWAVRYEGDGDNILYLTFSQWFDIDWLSDFFANNREDLTAYFKITDLNQAIYDTMSDAAELECLILDSNSDTEFDKLFRPLENQRASEMLLGKEKAKGTGGAIKLARTMQEREHTIEELRRLEMVRNMLIAEGITDLDGFNEFVENR